MKKLICITLLGFVFSLAPAISNAAVTEAPLGQETVKPAKKDKKHEKKKEKKSKKKAEKKHASLKHKKSL